MSNMQYEQIYSDKQLCGGHQILPGCMLYKHYAL
jgi:hypothetical protein